MARDSKVDSNAPGGTVSAEHSPVDTHSIKKKHKWLLRRILLKFQMLMFRFLLKSSAQEDTGCITAQRHSMPLKWSVVGSNILQHFLEVLPREFQTNKRLRIKT